MSELQLNAIVVRTLVDPAFQASLFDGQRESALADFALTEQERAALLRIKARDEDDFVGQLVEWISGQSHVT